MSRGYSPSGQNHAPRKDRSICNNYSTLLPHNATPTVQNVINRISSKLGIGTEFFQWIQLHKYHTTGYYRYHVDAPYTDNPRKITVMVYLNDVEEGGETHFPYQNLFFTPKTGRAVIWWNYPDYSLTKQAELSTLHEGMMVTKGEKWALTQWICEYGVNPFLNTCSVCWFRDSHLENDEMTLNEIKKHEAEYARHQKQHIEEKHDEIAASARRRIIPK